MYSIVFPHELARHLVRRAGAPTVSVPRVDECPRASTHGLVRAAWLLACRGRARWPATRCIPWAGAAAPLEKTFLASKSLETSKPQRDETKRFCARSCCVVAQDFAGLQQRHRENANASSSKSKAARSKSKGRLSQPPAAAVGASPEGEAAARPKRRRRAQLPSCPVAPPPPEALSRIQPPKPRQILAPCGKPFYSIL